jgi:hypothetical protein
MSLLALRFVMAAVVGIAASAAAVRLGAEPVPEADAQRVRSVITTQLQAFAADDADAAFAAATPGVREAIGSAGHFLALVRGAYPMIYQPASITFMRPELRGSAVLQLAEITDGQGKSWLALFSLEQQPDASWRISGCIVAENPWSPT